MNKKILAFGLLAGAFFFMNNKEDTTNTNNTNNNAGSGFNSNAGSGGYLPTGGSNGTSNQCTAFYLYNGARTCETDLPDLGFVWWSGLDGAGWYNINQFAHPRAGASGILVDVNGVQMSFQDAIKEWTRISTDTSNTDYTTAFNNLRRYYTGGGPLPSA